MTSLSPERKRLLDLILSPDALWIPNPGPQMQAYLSEADETFYGGAAGGGKTDLAVGLALTAHRQSLLLRRTFPNARSLMERIREVVGDRASINENEHLVRTQDMRMIEYGHCQHEKDKYNYQGRPHDFIGFEELTEFSRSVFEFVIRWNRSAIPDQRCRVVATFNPPMTTEGRWVIDYLAPWLKPDHPDPAAPGELRWFARVDDDVIEVETGEPFEHKGETIYPRSRTFIPARLSDNPFLDADPAYRANLQQAPAHLRAMLLEGRMDVAVADDEWQVFPGDWVRQAMDRWSSGRPVDENEKPVPLTAMGVDPARGGDDRFAIARFYENWCDEIVTLPGSATRTGSAGAQKVKENIDDGEDPRIGVDIIGIGSSTYDALAEDEAGLTVYAINASKSTKRRLGRFGFQNWRSMMIWRLREALNPEGEIMLALPPDPELAAELTAHRYDVAAGKIRIEPKDKIKERLGRSPDKSDAVAYGYEMASRG